MRELLNSKLIVTDSADSFYRLFPNPPLGLVLLNYTEGAGEATRAATLVPSSAWTLIFLCSYGTKDAIDKAKLIADNLIDNIIETTVNGQTMYFQSIHYFNTDNQQWQRRKDDGYCEVYTRDLFLSAYGLSRLYLRCGEDTYKQWSLKLIESIYKVQTAFSSLCGTELPAYLDGAFPEFYLRTDAGVEFYPVNGRVPLHLGDIAYDLVQTAIAAFGNSQQTAEGGTYYIGDINDRFHNFIRTNCIQSQRGVMETVGLPYMYMAPIEGTSDYTGKNLSPVYNQWGDVNWTSDTVLWSVLGLAKNEGSGAAIFVARAKALMINGFFYDVYTYTGVKDSEFPDLATQATIFYLEALRLTGGTYDYKTEQALMKVQVDSLDPNSNGLYYWSLEDKTVEMVATARIFTGFFNLEAFASGMPRKLYFDGVDTSTFGLSIIDVKGRWEIPEGEETSTKLPGMDGTYYHHTEFKERTIVVKGLLKHDSRSALVAAQKELNTLLNPKKGECELRFDDEYFNVYKGRLRGKTVMETVGSMEILNLQFNCSKPFIYGVPQYYKTSGSVWLLNRGSQKTPLRLTLTGPAEFPVISIGDSQIYINTSLGSTDIFIVDSEKLEITLNGAPAAHLAEGDFLYLEPGETEISTSAGNLEIEFSEMWL
ncbi:phage tail family protein [Metallumcola ferriviriculae]|uniref:Phage tail family protein n=1 Tax=Metallumcola ferriviriculae TaxID=3039180 RepID=A0AAU0UI54_9FIRM|nr:phage tail family protein [Desulfitibacteraceae bacterium MK1]